MEELFDIVDTDGNPVGTATRSQCHSDRRLLHAVVHLHIIDSRGRLYLQKRSSRKDICPCRWDTAVGGHISHGETVKQALQREAAEELGVDARQARFLYKYIWRGERESEFVYTHLLRWDGKIIPDRQEVSRGRFFTPPRLERKLKKMSFCTPNFRHEWDLLQETLAKFPEIF